MKHSTQIIEERTGETRKQRSKHLRTHQRFHEIWNKMVGRDTTHTKKKKKNEYEMKEGLSLDRTEHTTDRLIYKHGVVSALKEDRPHPASHGVCPVSTARTKYRVHKTEHSLTLIIVDVIWKNYACCEESDPWILTEGTVFNFILL